jgi:hypothetical protein
MADIWKRILAVIIGIALFLSVFLGFVVLIMPKGDAAIVYAPALIVVSIVGLILTGYLAGYLQPHSSSPDWTSLLFSPGLWGMCIWIMYSLANWRMRSEISLGTIFNALIVVSISWLGCRIGMY